jgi:U3 small nucleolar RNA-associated protein 21
MFFFEHHSCVDTDLEGLTALQKSDSPVDVFSTPPQLDGELITLTLLPRSRWQTLLNLDIIQVLIIPQMPSSFSDSLLQQRNKPKEPPKAPEKAPFFLPTLPGLEPRFASGNKVPQKENKKPTKRLDKGCNDVQSPFIHKLVAEAADGDCE